MKRAALMLSVFALAATAARADCVTTPQLCNLPVTSTLENPDLDEAIDVVLVGDGFTTAASWHTVATNAISTFKGQPNSGVYGSITNIYNFHVVDVISATSNVSNTDINDTALGMNTSGSVITAVASRVATAALNAPDVDVIIAIANGSGRANANYPSSLASGGTVRLGSSLTPISHELGHAIVQLADEYTEAALCVPQTEMTMLATRNVTADASCVKFSTVPGAGCVQGGKYCTTGVYRPASACLMRSSGNVAPCPVCRQAIRNVLLEKKTRLDYAAPWAVPQAPAAGATVSGTTNLTGAVFDDHFSPTRVTFVIDGVWRGAATTTGTLATLPFDTTALADGAHTLQVFADDAAGHAAPGASVTFNTSNFTVTGTSVLNITSPVGATVQQGKTFIQANATAPTPLWLALLVDGVPVAMTTGQTTIFSPWEASLGTHTIEVRGVDKAGNALTPKTTTVTVVAPSTDAGTPGNPPRLTLQAPQAWSAVGPAFLLQYVPGVPSTFTVRLLVDGVPVPPASLPTGGSGSGGTLNGETALQSVLIDASTWSLGPHQLQLEATDGASVVTSSVVPVVRVAPGAKPVALITSPSRSQTVAGTTQVAVTAWDDVGVTSVSLWVDGVQVATHSGGSTTFSWDTTALADGPHTLQARATDASGDTGASDDVAVTVLNTPPAPVVLSPADGATVPASLVPVQVESGAGSCLLELLVDGQPVASATGTRTTLPAMLSPGAHALRVRATDAAGHVVQSPVVNVTAANCTAASCNDGDACTTDSCGTSGLCVHGTTPGCCTTAADCDDGDTCTTDACVSGACAHTAVANCCNYGSQCDDGDACTTDVCSAPGGTCSHGSANCCATAADCDDGNSCTTDSCLPHGLCDHDWQGACCRNDADCDDGDACTTDSCSSGQCTHAAVANCCNTGAQCDDGDACTSDMCINHACRSTPLINCCATDADCVTLNPCETRSCVSNKCVGTAVAGCCAFDSECSDGDACTTDSCLNNVCTHQTLCCASVDDCDDGDACTTDTCSGGQCGHAAIPNCCATAADCDDGDACTADACTAGQCGHTAVPNCCASAADCDDGDACTADTCTAGQCGHAAVSNCCASADDCDDGDACTADACVSNACTHQALCCASAADCDDGDACTADTCTAGQCGHAAVSNCCASADDCDDGDACTADACVSNACTHQALCCTSADDCDDGDTCTTDTCDDGQCGHAAIAGCPPTQACDGGDCGDQQPGAKDEAVIGSCGCQQTTPGLFLLLALVLPWARRRRVKAAR